MYKEINNLMEDININKCDGEVKNYISFVKDLIEEKNFSNDFVNKLNKFISIIKNSNDNHYMYMADILDNYHSKNKENKEIKKIYMNLSLINFNVSFLIRELLNKNVILQKYSNGKYIFVKK